MQSSKTELIQEKIALAVNRGQFIGEHLEEMIRQKDLSPDLPDLVARLGAICLDVEYGPEIKALAKFSPRKLTVTEPTEGRILPHPFADFTGQVIKGVSDHSQLPVNLVRKTPTSALDKIRADETDLPVGLITFLNVYPPEQTPTFLTILAQAANPLLAKGGQLIISTVEDDVYTAEQLEEARELMAVCDLSAKLIEKDYGCAGRLFLICQK